MPATAPPSNPYLTAPAAHPIRAPMPMPSAVVEASRAPAPAGSKVWRGAPSMRRDHTRVGRACNKRKPASCLEIGPISADVVAVFSCALAFAERPPRLGLPPADAGVAQHNDLDWVDHVNRGAQRHGDERHPHP